MEDVMKKVLLLAIVLQLTILGCATRPVTPSGPPTAVPFVKLIQPTFVKEYENKVVSFDAVYLKTITEGNLIPEEYKQGYIRILLTSDVLGSGNAMAKYTYVVVPVSLADQVLAFKAQTKLAIVADAVPIIVVTNNGFTKTRTLLFVVKSLQER